MVSLYEDINEVVVAHIKKALEIGEPINVPDWISEVAESLADMILHAAPSDEQGPLVAYAHQQLDRHIIDKRVDGIGEARH